MNVRLNGMSCPLEKDSAGRLKATLAEPHTKAPAKLNGISLT